MEDQKRGIIYVARGVSVEMLRQVLGHPGLRWAYAERMADTGLGTTVDLLDSQPLGAPTDGRRPGVDLERWEHGRAFGPDLEIDWWCEGETFRLRALSEKAPPEGIPWMGIGDGLEAVGSPCKMLLYGAFDQGSNSERPTWSEARIPRRLAHPLKDEPRPERVALLGQDYARRGTVVLTRLVGVVPGVDETNRPLG
jgi:hypothetical protein